MVDDVNISQFFWSVCGGFHKWHWKYHATATDKASGKVGNSGDQNSKDGAAKNAALDLVNNQFGDSDCTCQSSTVPIGACPIKFSVCFMFNSTGAMDQKLPSFKGYAFNTLTKHEGSVHQYNDPKQAVRTSARVCLHSIHAYFACSSFRECMYAWVYVCKCVMSVDVSHDEAGHGCSHSLVHNQPHG
jgi:hypothetical protein